MGQVQNGRLYIKYRSSSMKNKANKCKMLINYILYQVRENHVQKFRFCLSSFFLSSFADKLNAKTIVLFEYCTHQTTALLPGIFLFWFGRRTSYDWRATATKLSVTVSKEAPRAWSSTSGAFVQLFRAWHV